MQTHITQVNLSNWKGRNGLFRLSPASVILGPNFTGKTAIPEAIRFALTGYLPDPIGKRPSAILQLSDNRGCGVELEFDNGRKTALSVQGGKSATLVGSVPADLALPPFLTDASKFFSMTAQERMSSVLAASAGVNRETVATLLNKALAGIDVMQRSVRDDCITKIKQALSYYPESVPFNPAKALDNLTEYVVQQAREKGVESSRDAAGLAGCTALLSGSKPRFDETELCTVNSKLSELRTTELSISSSVLKTDLRTIEQDLRKARDTIISSEYELSRLGEMECCPTCGAAETGWKDKVLSSTWKEREAARATVEHLIEEQARLETLLKHETQENEQRLKEVATERAKLTALRDELILAKRSLSEWVAAKARQAEIESKCVRTSVECEVYKQAKGRIQTVRKKLVEQSVQAVMDDANVLAAQLLNSPLEFSDGELGRRVSKLDILQNCNIKEGSWISHEAFSGTEVAISYAAFAVALCRQAPFKLVILDELGRLDPKLKKKLFQTMSSLVEKGWINQFIGVDTGKEFKIVDISKGGMK